MALISFRNIMRWVGFGGTSQYTGEQISVPIGGPGALPVDVTEDAALCLSAVWGAVRILAETISTMNLFVAKITPRGPIVDQTHELYRLLCMSPNDTMTHIEFWESMMLNLVLRGNAYALVSRNTLGEVIALYPLAASQMQPIRLKTGMWYIYNLDGVQTGFAAEDILHIKIFGNGYVGLSPLAYGARAMSTAVAADQFSGQFFSRGGKPGGVLKLDRVLTKEQREEFRKNFREIHESPDSAHKLFLLEAGMEFQQVQINPNDLQMLESRRYGVQDVARFFGVPSFLLNESQGSTTWGTGLEQQMLGFYTLTVRPYAKRIAAACKKRLVATKDWRKIDIYYDFDELLAADMQAKANFYSVLANNGIMSRNEAREGLGMPKSAEKNADSLTVQTALVPLEKLGEKPEPPPAPVQPGEPNEDGTEDPVDGAE